MQNAFHLKNQIGAGDPFLRNFWSKFQFRQFWLNRKKKIRYFSGVRLENYTYCIAMGWGCGSKYNLFDWWGFRQVRYLVTVWRGGHLIKQLISYIETFPRNTYYTICDNRISQTTSTKNKMEVTIKSNSIHICINKYNF